MIVQDPVALTRSVVLAVGEALLAEQKSEKVASMRAHDKVYELLRAALTDEWNAAVMRLANKAERLTFTVPVGFHGSPNLRGSEVDLPQTIRTALRAAVPLKECSTCGRPDCIGSDLKGCPRDS